ncbi:MAG: DUF2970 domain-containing protein [Pseudomonadales bacterium]
MATDKESEDKKVSTPVPFWKVVLSVMQASFGVQDRKTRERDFTRGNIKAYIAAAIIFTLAFVLTIGLIVKLILANVG